MGPCREQVRCTCPHRAEGPQSADRSDTPEERCPGSAGILPASGRRPAKRRQERHAPATPPPEAWLGAMSWERGPLARNGPKARKAPTGATRPSRLLPRPRRPSDGCPAEDGRSRKRRRPVRLPMWRACGPLAGGTPALPGTAPERHSQTLRRRAIPSSRRGGRWVRVGNRFMYLGAMSWERGHLARNGPKARKAPTRTTRPSRPLPDARGHSPVALGAMRSPGSAGVPSACPCGGPAARLRAGRPRSQGRRPQLADPAPQGHSKLSARRLMGPCREHVRVLVSDVLGARASGPHRAEGPQGADRSDTPEPATPPLEARPREQCPGSDGVSRKRRRPVRLPMWRACGPLAGGTPALPGTAPERHSQTLRRRAIPSSRRGGRWVRVGNRFMYLGAMSWERGHLARIGPKARKAPTGATPPSHPLPRPRHGPGSDEVSRKRRRPVRLPMWRACGPLRAGRPRSQGRHPSVTRRPCAAGPFQALGEAVDGSVSGTGSCTWERCPGSAGILPASGRRPARRRQERHARASHPPARGTAPGAMSWERWGLPEAQASRPLAHVAGLRPACGRDARAPRDGARASLADPAPQGHSKLSARRLMGPCREQVRVLGSDVLGARASGPHRAEGPQGADRSDTPEPATPPPEAWLRERCPGSAGILPASGRRPAKRRQERHARASHPPARGTAPGAMSWERWGLPEAQASRPLAHVAGLRPACGRDARAPRDGARASTRRLCAAGPFQALGEAVDGSVSGTGSWTSAGHVLVARHPLLPRRARTRLRFEHPRQSDESWCSSPRVTSRWIGDRLFERPRPIPMALGQA